MDLPVIRISVLVWKLMYYKNQKCQKRKIFNKALIICNKENEEP